MITNFKTYDYNVYYDIESKNIKITKECSKMATEIQPLVDDIQYYLLQCDENDFNGGNHKLKFKEVHNTKILEIINSYKNILENEKLKFIFILYGYWFSELSITYYEKYLDLKSLHSFVKNTLICRRKCSQCNEYIGITVHSRSEFELIKNENQNYYICEDCDKKNYKDEIKKRDEETKRRQDVANKEIQDLKSMLYKDYLETDHWKQLRKRKLRLSGYKCQICASKENLNVHHNTYENRGCEKDEDLVVLCNECHKKHHGINSDNIKPCVVPIGNTYKTKLFISDINKYDNTIINEFILNNVKELKDIKPNLSNNTYTTLLIYS